MSRKHRWIGNQCIKCGLLRERKTGKLLMAISSQPPYNHYKYESYYEYNDGLRKTNKRPDCKN